MENFKKNYISLLYLISFIWLVFLIDLLIPFNLNSWGILPREISGLRGIICSPFLHVNLQHIISNTVPILIFGMLVIWYYRKNAFKVFAFSILISGSLVWVFARKSLHIGASSLIYALFTFLIFAGIYQRKIGGIIISIIVGVMYSGLIWGVLPTQTYISWEGHLSGAIAGFILSRILYKKAKS